MERLEEGTLKLLSGEAAVAIYRSFYEPLVCVVVAAAVVRLLLLLLEFKGCPGLQWGEYASKIAEQML